MNVTHQANRFKATAAIESVGGYRTLLFTAKKYQNMAASPVGGSCVRMRRGGDKGTVRQEEAHH